MLWKHLLGVLFIAPLGRVEDLEMAMNLTAHFQSLGAKVPLLTVNAVEQPPDVKWWNASRQVKLRAAPYNLAEASSHSFHSLKSRLSSE